MAIQTIRTTDDEFRQLLKSCFHKSSLRHPLYQPKNLAYYEVLSSAQNSSSSIDRSFVVADEIDVLAAVQMLSISGRGAAPELSCHATIPVWFFENSDVSRKRLRKSRTVIKTELLKIIEKDNIARVWYEDPLTNQDLSYLGRLLLDMGSAAQPVVRQIIDLNQTEPEMFKHVRKSYKSLINWGRRELRLSVYDKENIPTGLMEQFRKLHVAVAGRETRKKETWQMQEAMIRAGEAFVIFGELNRELVTAALFSLSDTYCFYGVSASNRHLFDKPLSHAVIWEAILYAQRAGCRFFELGLIQFPGIGNPLPTKKELSISTFKHGFGGRSELRLSIIWEHERAAQSEKY